MAYDPRIGIGYLQSLFLSCIFTSILWGIGVTQLYLYFKTHSKNDSWMFRCYPLLVWCLITVLQCFTLRWGYQIFVQSSGSLKPLIENDVKKLPLVIILTSIIDTLTQAYYARRIRKLSRRNKPLILAVIVAIAIQLSAGLYYSVRNYKLALAAFPIQFINIVRCLYAVTTFTDLFLAVTFILLLHGMRTGHRRSEATINRLVFYTTSSGAITAVESIAALISSVVAPDLDVHMFLYSLVPLSYANCLLVLLNSRNTIRSILDNSTTNEANLKSENCLRGVGPFIVEGGSDLSSEPGTRSGASSSSSTLARPGVDYDHGVTV